MVKDSSVEDDFQDVVESAAQVYISSFWKMDNPIRQTRVESNELNRQWQTITQGREEIGLEGDNTYLDSAKIKEQGLSVGTAARLDLALFSHFAFSPTLDLERVQRVVKDFTQLFLQKKVFSVKANQKPLQEIYTQLVAVLLALYTRHSRTTPKRITSSIIKESITADIIPGPISGPELRTEDVIQLTQRVANDMKRLESLYNNTLLKLIHLVKAKEKSLPRPADAEAVIVLQAKHEEIVAKIYKKEPKDKSVDEFKDEVWLPEENTQNKVSTRQQQQQKESVESDVEVEKTPDKQSSKTNSASQTKKQQLQQQQEPAYDENEMDDDDFPQPPAKLLLSHNSTKAGTSTSKHSLVKVTRRTSVTQATEESKQPKSRKRQKIVSDSEDGSSQEDEEEEEEEPTKKKKRSEKNTKIRQTQRQGSSGPSSSSSSPSSSSSYADSDNDSVHDPEPAVDASGRRKSRRWTEKEVQTLMKLVPKFQYDDSEVMIKKRTIKWAALKAYDRSHGHVLRHRNQVMLKDKYREQTDRGQHRQRVRELNLARVAEKEKATKEAALKAAATEVTTEGTTEGTKEKATREVVEENDEKTNE